jgi:putative ABC transport system substrate-binding protein
MRPLLLALAIGFLIASSAVAESTTARVAFLSADAPSAEAIGWFDTLRQGLRNHGWDEGRNLVIESRRTPGQFDALDDAAVELVRLKVDVIVTDSTPAAHAALKATQTIPIVMAMAGDPVGTGLVTNLARPGGNITGMTLLHSELGNKRLEMLKEIVPGVARIAVLVNPENPVSQVAYNDAQSAARVHGITLQPLELRTEDDWDRARSTLVSRRTQAIWIFDDPVTLQYSRQIADFAVRRKLPTLVPERAYMHDGALLAYGPSFTDLCRRAASYVDKILRGAKPGDLPIQQPTKFDLVINLRTAKTLGLTIPESLLVGADEVIR